MGGENTVRHIGPARWIGRFLRIDVERSAAQPAGAQGVDQRILVHQLPARDIDQQAIGAKRIEDRGGDHAAIAALQRSTGKPSACLLIFETSNPAHNTSDA